MIGIFLHLSTGTRLAPSRPFHSHVDTWASLCRTCLFFRFSLEDVKCVSLCMAVEFYLHGFCKLGAKCEWGTPPGADSSYAMWKCLNRLRSGVGRTKVTLSKWGYLNDRDAVRDCGTEPQTMQHLLTCPLLEQPCTASDLAEFNCKGQQCAQLWLNHI